MDGRGTPNLGLGLEEEAPEEMSQQEKWGGGGAGYKPGHGLEEEQGESPAASPKKKIQRREDSGN